MKNSKKLKLLSSIALKRHEYLFDFSTGKFTQKGVDNILKGWDTGKLVVPTPDGYYTYLLLPIYLYIYHPLVPVQHALPRDVDGIVLMKEEASIHIVAYMSGLKVLRHCY